MTRFKASRPAGTDIVLTKLKAAARMRRTATYSELADAAGITAVGMGPPLGHIREACRAREYPWIGVLAVSKSTGLPTEGLFIGVEGFSMNVKSPDFVVWWQAMVDRVYATDWSAFELPPDEQ